MIFKKFVDCFVKEVLNSKYFPAPRFVPSFCTETPFDQINLKIQIRNVTELVAESLEQDINLSKKGLFIHFLVHKSRVVRVLI